MVRTKKEKITIQAEQADYLEYTVIQPLKKVEPKSAFGTLPNEPKRADGGPFKKKIVYENCAECNEPIYNETQRKYRLCYHCYKNQSSIGLLSIS